MQFLYFCCCRPFCFPINYIMVTGPNWPYTWRFARQAKSFIWVCIDVSPLSPLPVLPVLPVSHLPVLALYQCTPGTAADRCAKSFSATRSMQRKYSRQDQCKIFQRQDQCREVMQNILTYHYWPLARNTFESHQLTLRRSRGVIDSFNVRKHQAMLTLGLEKLRFE